MVNRNISSNRQDIGGVVASFLYLIFLISFVMNAMCLSPINAFALTSNSKRIALHSGASRIWLGSCMQHRETSLSSQVLGRYGPVQSRSFSFKKPSWGLQHRSILQHGLKSIPKDESSKSYHSTNKANNYSLELFVPTPEDMEDMGGLLSVGSVGGDVILLDGDLGAGKTCFSRGFVRGKTGLQDERVTSPTYLLSNSYFVDEETKIYHMDLYRLSGLEKDLLPLDLENVFSNGISLIEWPSRLGTMKPTSRLDVTLTIDSTDENDDIDVKCRRMRLEPYGDRWVERINFLKSEGYFEDLIVNDPLE